MPRISRLRALQTLNLGAAPTARVPFAAFSTTLPARDLRSKLWKGEAPGPEDPYTQRPEPEDPSSNLPDEARQYPQSSTNAHPSRLVLPPRRTEALTEKELTHNDPTYTPATSIEDLEVAPTLKNWWNQPGHWGEESGFVGFAKAGRVVDEEVLEVYLRRAVVEVLALDQAGKLSEWSTKKWSEGTPETLQQTLSIPVTVAEDGTASVSGDASAIAEQLVSHVEETSVSERISLEEAKSMTQQWDQAWKNLVLNDETKFAVCSLSLKTSSKQMFCFLTWLCVLQLRKRLYQLTGNLIPDAKLGAARTVKHLLTLAAKQPKAQKLADLLETQQKLTDLPNVRVRDRRITPIDKETEMGRWKVIEEELKKRGLPVTGTGNLSGHKERDWMRQNY